MKTKDLLLIKTSKIVLFFILPLSLLFLSLSFPSLTGFSINSEIKLVSGSLLAIAVVFFIFLLFLIQIRPKPYKSY